MCKCSSSKPLYQWKKIQILKIAEICCYFNVNTYRSYPLNRPASSASSPIFTFRTGQIRNLLPSRQHLPVCTHPRPRAHSTSCPPGKFLSSFKFQVGGPFLNSLPPIWLTTPNTVPLRWVHGPGACSYHSHYLRVEKSLISQVCLPINLWELSCLLFLSSSLLSFLPAFLYSSFLSLSSFVLPFLVGSCSFNNMTQAFVPYLALGIQ